MSRRRAFTLVELLVVIVRYRHRAWRRASVHYGQSVGLGRSGSLTEAWGSGLLFWIWSSGSGFAITSNPDCIAPRMS